VLDQRAGLHDDARELVPGYMRQHHVAVVAHPGVPVAAAKPGGGDADHHARLGALRIVHADQLRDLLEGAVPHRVHG
jgi:hypothetical protein